MAPEPWAAASPRAGPVAVALVLAAAGCFRTFGTPPAEQADGDADLDHELDAEDADPDGGEPDADHDGRDAEGDVEVDAEGDAGDADLPRCLDPVCDLWPPCGCPAGQKCTAASDGTRFCGPAGTTPHGIGCESELDCSAGTTCLGRTGDPLSLCSQYCSADEQCDGLGHGSLCVVGFATGPPPPSVACTTTCDPLTAVPCPPTLSCVLVEGGFDPAVAGTHCMYPRGTGTQGSACSGQGDCAATFRCLSSRCHRYCIRGAPDDCPEPTTCSEATDRPVVSGTEYGVCR